MDTITRQVFDAVLSGDQEAVKEKASQILETGGDPVALLNEGMIAAMAEVGRRFEEGSYYVPEMLISARAMKAGLAVLHPYLQEAGGVRAGTVVICTVKGDLHDIGKNLVAMMLEGGGFSVHDLGTDVSAEAIVEHVMESKPDIVALSALLTTTMASMRTSIEALRAAGVRGEVKVIIGGAPVTEAYAEEIGADGFAPDASRAVTLARVLLSGQ